MRTETWVPFRICSVSLRSSELLVRLCFLSSSFPHWLAGLPPTADWYDSWAGPYHCCLWSSVHLLSKSVVLRYYQDSLTEPFSVLCTHLQYERFYNCQRRDGALRFMTLPEPFRMNCGLSSAPRVTLSLQLHWSVFPLHLVHACRHAIICSVRHSLPIIRRNM